MVTAKSSCGAESAFKGGGGGIEIDVTGDECCEGSRRSSEVKEFQYFCSAVTLEGPLGSFSGCTSWTSAAIVRVGEMGGGVALPLSWASAMRCDDFFSGAVRSIRRASLIGKARLAATVLWAFGLLQHLFDKLLVCLEILSTSVNYSCK